MSTSAHLARTVNWTDGLVVGPRHLEEIEAYAARLARLCLQLALPGAGMLPGSALDWSVSGTTKTIVVTLRRLTAVTADGALVAVGPGNEVSASFETGRVTSAPRLFLACGPVPGETVGLLDGGFDDRAFRLREGEPPFRLPRFEIRLRPADEQMPEEFVFGEIQLGPAGPRPAEAFLPHAHAFSGHPALDAAVGRLRTALDSLTPRAWEVAVSSEPRGQVVASVIAAWSLGIREALDAGGPAAVAGRSERIVAELALASAALSQGFPLGPARRRSAVDAGVDVAFTSEVLSWLRRVLDAVQRAPAVADTPKPPVETWNYRTAPNLETLPTFDLDGSRVKVTGKTTMLEDLGGAWLGPITLDGDNKEILLVLDGPAQGGAARLVFEDRAGVPLASSPFSLAPQVAGHRNFRGRVALQAGLHDGVERVRVLDLPQGLTARAVLALWSPIQPGRKR